MSFFQRLQHETAAARAELLEIPFLRAGSAGQISLNSYVAFLEQAYHHVKHTVPLLMACGARLPGRYEWLRTAIGEYIAEEMGHQEWILNDIEQCGSDSRRIRDGHPGIETEVLIAYVYDSVDRRNPVSFFGMVHVLEGTSVALASQAARNLQRTLGLPACAFRYLSSHGSLDVEHVEFFRGLMDRIDSREDQYAVIHLANVVYQLYGDIFRSLPLEYSAEVSHEAAG